MSFTPKDYSLFYNEETRVYLQFFSESIPFGREDIEKILFDEEVSCNIGDLENKLSITFGQGIPTQSKNVIKNYYCFTNPSNGKIVFMEKTKYELIEQNSIPAHEVFEIESSPFIKIPPNGKDLFIIGKIKRKENP